MVLIKLLICIEGKEVMKTQGTKAFAQAASRSYSTISMDDKEKLKAKCTVSTQPLTTKTIKQNGQKVFKNIDKQVKPVYLRISVL